jgi:hypothetical protein
VVRFVPCFVEQNGGTYVQQGTGKTSTISKAAQEWENRGNTVWIAAQSNVAVKNIAERLIRDGVEFRILVSKEFHFEW